MLAELSNLPCENGNPLEKQGNLLEKQATFFKSVAIFFTRRIFLEQSAILSLHFGVPLSGVVVLFRKRMILCLERIGLLCGGVVLLKTVSVLLRKSFGPFNDIAVLLNEVAAPLRQVAVPLEEITAPLREVAVALPLRAGALREVVALWKTMATLPSRDVVPLLGIPTLFGGGTSRVKDFALVGRV